MKKVIIFSLLLTWGMGSCCLAQLKQKGKLKDTISQYDTLGNIVNRIIVDHVEGTSPQGDSVVPAPPLLKIREITESGQAIELKPNYLVVDPNSQLEITINAEVLQNQAGATFSPDITARLELMKKLLQLQKQAITNIGLAVSAYKSGQMDVSAELLKAQKPIVQAIRSDPEALQIFKSLGNPVETIAQYQNLFRTATILLGRLQEKLLAEAKSKGVYIQLGAWIDTKKNSTPVHIPGFDDYTPQAPVSVERFQTTLTAEQRAALQQISQLAATANKDGLPAALEGLRANAGQLLSGLQELPSAKNALQIYNKVEELKKKTDAELGDIKSTVLEAGQILEAYLIEVNGYVDKYRRPVTNTDANALLLGINQDIDALATSSTVLADKMKSYVKDVNTKLSFLPVGIRADLATLLPQLVQLQADLKTDMTELPKKATDFVKLLVNGGEILSATHEFTEKVKKISLTELKTVALLDLKTGGQRDLGDQITIRLGSGTADGPFKEQMALHYSLYFCSVYARTAVGFLFVSPTPLFQRTGEKSFLRYAPSYSILLKGFWKSAEKTRTSLAYHKFFSPGLGLNFSALDFNTDGAMELGIGGVFTIFQDFVQLGYGINTYDGRGYAFFGFKLPVGAFSIH